MGPFAESARSRLQAAARALNQTQRAAGNEARLVAERAEAQRALQLTSDERDNVAFLDKNAMALMRSGQFDRARQENEDKKRYLDEISREPSRLAARRRVDEITSQLDALTAGRASGPQNVAEYNASWRALDASTAAALTDLTLDEAGLDRLLAVETSVKILGQCAAAAGGLTSVQPKMLGDAATAMAPTLEALLKRVEASGASLATQQGVIDKYRNSAAFGGLFNPNAEVLEVAQARLDQIKAEEARAAEQRRLAEAKQAEAQRIAAARDAEARRLAAERQAASEAAARERRMAVSGPDAQALTEAVAAAYFRAQANTRDAGLVIRTGNTIRIDEGTLAGRIFSTAVVDANGVSCSAQAGGKFRCAYRFSVVRSRILLERDPGGRSFSEARSDVFALAGGRWTSSTLDAAMANRRANEGRIGGGSSVAESETDRRLRDQDKAADDMRFVDDVLKNSPFSVN